MTATLGLLVAALGGAMVGLERQWSGHAHGPHARFAGIRTFTLIGGLAGIAGWLAMSGLMLVAAILIAATAALIVAGYVSASRHDIDGTTEAAALVVLAAGVVAGAGHLVLASGVSAATALLLLEKTRLHALVAGIDDASLRASARFAAMALIILPLLPSGPYGPYGAIRPRELWALVLFFSGLSFLGWGARRIAGSQRGAIIAGLLGGIISSTSVTLRFARDSRVRGSDGMALAGGAVGACTVMLVRVVVACAVLNPALALTLPRLLWPAAAIGAVAVWGAWRRNGSVPEHDEAIGSPLALRTALEMTALFQVVLLIILAVRARWSSGALLATSALVGLTDLDALTLSLARSTASSVDLAPVTLALVTGIISNTFLKLGVALAIGRGAFRTMTALILAVMAALVGVAVWFRV
ncbi:MAG: MgtC/SapB family protein [Vicinamibacterales bacterium]